MLTPAQAEEALANEAGAHPSNDSQVRLPSLSEHPAKGGEEEEVQEGGCHGAYTLQGEGKGGSSPEQQPGRAGGARFPTLCCWALPWPPTRAPPPTEPCQAPPSSCTHTQHDTGPVTCTQHSASGRQAGRLPTHQRGWQGHGQTGAPATSRPGGPHAWHSQCWHCAEKAEGT